MPRPPTDTPAAQDFASQAGPDQVHLRLLLTSDLHMHVYPYDYYTDQPNDAVGLSRVATLIAQARTEAPNSLTFDNGDFLEGNPMGDYLARAGALTDNGHPFVAAMNAVGYDAGTIGNHDFNYGLDYLMRATRGAEYPLVLANIATRKGRDAGDDDTLFPPYTILERSFYDGSGRSRPLRIGVIGFTPPQVMVWDKRHLHGRVAARGILEAARTLVPGIRAEGADLVIALSHSGITAEPEHPEMENASLPLAAIDGIDVVLTGHLHRVFPAPDFGGMPGVDVAAGTLFGKPSVMPGMWGSHLGVVDLMLHETQGGWRIEQSASQARPIAELTADNNVRPLTTDTHSVLAPVAAAHRATLDHIRRPVGRIVEPLHTYFSMIRDCAAVRLVAQAQMAYVRAALRGGPYADLPLVSAAAPFKAGGYGGPDHFVDVPKGDVAIRHVADLYSFPNQIRALRLTGAQLRDWLELSAAAFNRIKLGTQDNTLFAQGFPSYNFDAIHELSYGFDISAPARYDALGRCLNADAARVMDLRHQGRPVTDDMLFILATNSYRASGAGSWPGTNAPAVVASPDFNRDVLLRYITENSPVSAGPGGGWQLAPMPGTCVTFATGPGARTHAATSGLTLEELGTTSTGFVKYRMWL